jgi:hypothetical protein
MANKFKVGNLIDFAGALGIVLEVGLDYPNNGNRRCRFATIHWADGDTMMYFEDYGCLYNSAEVIG